jgi:epoxyqueuosine reductase
MAAGREQIVADAARAAGFPLVGCAPVGPLPVAERFSRLARGGPRRRDAVSRAAPERGSIRACSSRGRGASCASASRTARRRRRRRLARDARAAASPRTRPARTTIARSARGSTRSREPRSALPRLAPSLVRRHGAILEREWARRAGIGWIAKNTLVLHRHAGSYFFLGELVTDLELDPVPLPADHCGTCMRCVVACPTGALEQGYTMEPRRCISYLTIEHRSAIPRALRPAIENWVFGCDVCQEVCPWNGDATRATDDPEAAWLAPRLDELVRSTRARSPRATAARPSRVPGGAGSSATRPSRSETAEIRPPCRRSSPRSRTPIRSCAGHARGRSGASAARRRGQALERARRREPSAEARAGDRRRARRVDDPSDRRKMRGERTLRRAACRAPGRRPARSGSRWRTSHAFCTRSAGSGPSGIRPPAIWSWPPADFAPSTPWQEIAAFVSRSVVRIEQ